ncbi:MAG TPA: hypothetical protein VFQ45_18370 [Longimicrobium sp.]|nr:hypothetical protein [Longimicrobium sp.]
MVGNKQAYEEAYQRALHGKAGRKLWEWFMVPFEDTYTRQSREAGTRDGAAARAAAAAANQPALQ